MLKRLVDLSIRFRGVVVALACAAVAYGAWVAEHAKLDIFPEFAPPQVVVQTEAPGLSPEEVEALVTLPVERALSGAGDLESVRSQSIQGLSAVTAYFRDGTDVARARQMVAERLAAVAAELPAGVKPPAMAPLTSATSTMLAVGLTSGSRSPMELRGFADWTLRPRLLAVPGVAKVNVFGGEVRQLQVQVRPERLVAYGLAIEDVLEAARKATGVRGAGFIETAAQRIVLRTEGQRATPEDLGDAAIAGAPGLRLRDVARVVEAPEPKVGDAAIDGEPGVILIVSSQLGANTMEVTEACERALEEMRPAIEERGIRLHPPLFRPASFIESAIRNVRSSLLSGGVLVAAVLFLFLFHLRTALISLTAIPLSLLAAVIVLERLGFTLNTLTLGGLAIAIGEVVDDAIIDVENIFRRLRENRARGGARSAFRVVLEASIEVRGAVVYATFVVALVFLPVLAMSGLEGRLFAPLASAYILAVLASLGVALTVTPALSMLLLPAAALRDRESPIVARLRSGYRRLLEAVARRPRAVVGLAAALCAAAAAVLPFFGGAFLPEFREGHFIVHMTAVPGTSLAESLRLGRAAARALLETPHVRSVGQIAGRAEQGDDTWGTQYSELNVDLLPLSGEEAEAAEDEIRAALAKVPGAAFSITPFLTERIEETIAGVTAEVAIKLFGDDLGALDRAADEVARAVRSIPGAADVQVESPGGQPETVIRLRPERLRRFGLEPVEVLDALGAAYQGARAAQVYEGSRVTDVTVILDEALRRDPEAVGGLLVRSRSGARVRLHEVADVFPATGRYAIVHEEGRRRQAVTLNVRGRDVASFVAAAREKLARDVRLPDGVYAVFAGAAEAQARARRELLLHSALAGLGIVLLLAIVFRSPRNLVLVLANLPFALVGGVAAVFLGGGSFTIGSLVGFVTLFGITTRNSIMMVSHFDHLVAEEGMAWGPETALRGASERLAPVLMTALVTALGLLPIALGAGDAGREIEGPMALVILGGLLTSTAMNLLVLPVLAVRYGRFAKPRCDDDAGPGSDLGPS
jgi:CzcA family heavy metal efflux pump